MPIAQEPLSPDFQQQVRQFQQRIQQQNNAHLIDDIERALEQSSVSLEQIELLYLKVVSLRLQNQFEAAINTANQLLALHPEHARTFQELGHIQLALGQELASVAGFKKATQLNPTLIVSWRTLQTLNHLLTDEEKNATTKQINKLSGMPAQLVGAMDLFYEGKLYMAEQVCRQVLQAHKHHPDAMQLLADIGIQLKVYGDAEFLLESCVELYPDNLEAREKYLFILSKTGKFDSALKQANALLERAPDESRFKVAKATALVGIGDVKAAINIYQEVLATQVDAPGIFVLLGHAYKAAAELDNAISSYQKAYQITPHFGDAYWSLANTKTYRFTDAEIAQMQTQLSHHANILHHDDKVHFHFALAKAFEDSQDVNNAFHHYQQGNRLQSEATQYSPDVTHKQVTRQISHCTKELFKQRHEVGFESDAPIFITGLPRAGSTLLEQILASHSMVDGTMELHNILSFAARLTQSGYPENLRKLPDKTLHAMGEAYIEQTRIYRKGAPYFIDKMPNNFLHIGLIKLILPKAKIIDARRHPMACCFSGFKQYFAEGQEFSYDLNHIARYYQDYLTLMTHWHRVLPNHILTVKHEDVIEDLETQVRRMLDYLGLPFESQCLEFHKTKRLVKTPSSEQVRQPIYNSGEQWKRFEPLLAELQRLLQPELNNY